MFQPHLLFVSKASTMTNHPNLSTCTCRNCTHVRKQQQRALRATNMGRGSTIVDVWNATLKSFPCLRPFLPTTIHISSRTVGPKHDPYVRDRIDVTRRGQVHSYISCGLAGDSYEVDGVEQIGPSNYFGPSPTNVAWTAFTVATGGTPDQWQRWYNRIHRNDIEDPVGCLSDYI